MKLVLPSALSALMQPGDRRVSPGFYQYWLEIGRALMGQGGIVQLPSYTVATLPDAAANVQGLIYVSDGASNKRLAVSDGTNWRFPDGAVVT